MNIEDRNTVMRAVALIAEHGRNAADEIRREIALGGLEAWEVAEAAAQLEDLAEAVHAPPLPLDADA